MRDPKRVLLIVTGRTIEPVRLKFGIAERLFENVIGPGHTVIPYVICDDWPSQPVPRLDEFDGVIMTGSVSMVGDDTPWMHAAKKLITQCLVDDTPFLGVCFGHQILGSACGAKVGPNPIGRANGSCLVTVQKKISFFERMASSFVAQISHRDVILEERPEFEVIATAPHDPRHSIQVGKSAFGVQFHPEWNIDISRAYIDAREEFLGKALADTMRASLAPSPTAELVIKQFIEDIL